MFDMGLGGMGGAAGAGDATNILFQQRMEAARLQQQDQQFKAQLAQQDALTRLKAQEVSEATRARVESQQQLEASRKETERQHNVSLMSAQLDQIPTDAPISGSTMGKMTEAGIAPERFAPQPITPDVPASIAAPGADAPMPGTIANSPAPNQVSFTRIPTAQERQHQQDEADRIAAQRNPVADHAANRAFDAAHPLPHEKKDALRKVEHKDPATGRTIIEWLPESELKGKTFDKGNSASVESRLASAEAVAQTGADMITQLSDPAIAAKLGPVMGRYNSVQEWMGNPPPELSELAGEIDSYSMATLGVHSMRSGAAMEKIKDLLSKKHTPESLIAAIKGLNAFSSHFMENEGRKTSTGTTGGGAHKKYNPATGQIE